ncbi:hypothetical protein DM02DRAFT_717128 [Periconia macrospinosa]|uniref:WW domain-containing protein n=1 Tax=Periconia macrospinosa TaxID=97972 RepID=A0A2V1DWS5_9PLEO|nr:hypothetical protein DM02DRAFT_717128 [Periconia macrospinosa]
MADIPVRPPGPPPPLPPGWTEHKAPAGHVYYHHKETKKSTYTRPLPDFAFQQTVPPPPPQPYKYPSFAASSSTDNYNVPAPQNTIDPKKEVENLIFGGLPPSRPFHGHRGQDPSRGASRGRFGGGPNNFSERKRHVQDRPKHRNDIPGCAPWVLVRTKLGRRFVWNKDTNESFWKFPPDVMKAVVEFDRVEREKKERRERGEPSENEEEDTLAEIEAELGDAEEEMQHQIVEVDGEEGMEDAEEYEEVEVTDDEGEEGSHPQKRQKTEELPADQNMEAGEDDDLAWQLAQMEEMEGGLDDQYEDEEPLSEEDCKALFKELLDDMNISPFTPWDKVLEGGTLYDDERYKALSSMSARKDCFNEWAKEKAQILKEQKAQQQKRDPRIPYIAFLDRFATPKLYWPEFKRKFRKEPEMKDTKLPEKEKEKLFREHIKRLGMRSSDLKADLTSLLRAQPLATLNRSTSMSSLPESILTDLRYISLAPSTRDSLIKTYLSTLPPPPEGTSTSAEEDAEASRKREERRRREKALAQRERKVQEEKRRQERELAYGKGRLREEEMELDRAMKVGKEGLKAQLEG